MINVRVSDDSIGHIVGRDSCRLGVLRGYVDKYTVRVVRFVCHTCWHPARLYPVNQV
jgi:hypothetical protein